MSIRQNVFIVGLFSLLMTCSVFSEQLHPKYSGAVLQAGVFGAWQGKSQQINIAELIGDRFTVKHHFDENILLGAGYFFSGAASDWYQILYGVNAFYFANTQVKGNVIQEDMFTNLSYRYRLTHYPIYADVKMLATLWNSADLAFDLGIGPNFLHTSRFYETSLDEGMTIPDNIFSGRTTTTFSATAGFGVRFNHTSRCIPLELSYRFFYLGQGKFTTQADQTLNTLKTGNVYANALILSAYF